ncbi:MAG: ParB/RepB/Spo0J family partition protein [Deltaproteobacteria bacterium]|nr:ParB/RepB/Spo0J family partition protein [Deltaproteobacteria bacterium]
MKKSAAENLRKLTIPQRARTSLENTLGLERSQLLTTLSIERIVPNADQPRRHQSARKFADMVLSVRERGILQPIRVRELQDTGQYEIIAGERRWRAAKEVGLREIPAVVVRQQSQEEAYIDALVENVVREDLNPIDRAEALSKIKVHLGAHSTWDEVAASGMLGISRRQIFHLLGLTTLPDAVKEDIRSNILSEKHGRALRSLRDTPVLQAQAHEAMKTQKMSGDEALTFVKQLKRSAVVATQQVLKIYYRSNEELIAALEEKLQMLRTQSHGEATLDEATQ